jgi:ATP-dependent RNA circularization protein (DNA/RNA ligase family)
MTTEVLGPHNPTASPTVVATSPAVVYYVFDIIADHKNQPSIAEYVTHFHEENPLADSQEGCEVANDLVCQLRGVPKKKRFKN